MRNASSVPRGSRPITDRLEEASTPVTETGCWIWLSHTNNGYGVLRINGRSIKAHRASWMVYRSMIPKGQKVLHICDVPCCINPDHLFLGTQKDNVRDMYKKGRQPDMRGEKNTRSKLNRDQADQIRTSTKTCRELASEFGISMASVSAIRTGKSWA